MLVPSSSWLSTLQEEKNNAVFQKEFQATREEILIFKAKMDEVLQKRIFKHDQDDDINRALKAINQDELAVKNRSSCIFL